MTALDALYARMQRGDRQALDAAARLAQREKAGSATPAERSALWGLRALHEPEPDDASTDRIIALLERARMGGTNMYGPSFGRGGAGGLGGGGMRGGGFHGSAMGMPGGGIHPGAAGSARFQPGMGHPGMGHPGMGHPGMGHPGMGHPGMHPGMGHPGHDHFRGRGFGGGGFGWPWWGGWGGYGAGCWQWNGAQWVWACPQYGYGGYGGYGYGAAVPTVPALF